MATYMEKYGHLHFRFNGILYDEVVFRKESLEKLADYEDIREDDVIVWSYPKSGTHLAMDIAWKLMFNGDLDKYAADSEELWFEVHPADYIPAHNPAAKFAHSLEDLSAYKSPRIIGTHVYFDIFPKKLQDGAAKIIYVSRNPKDVCVSFYEMLVKYWKLCGRDAIDWADYVELFLDGNDVVGGPWAAHLKSFYTVKDNKNILWVKYEDLIADLQGQVQRISDFLGRQLGDEIITKIAESCKFEAVRKQFPNSMHLRKGRVGSWKERFTVAQSERFDQQIMLNLQK